jgi:hypothetical protein
MFSPYVVSRPSMVHIARSAPPKRIAPMTIHKLLRHTAFDAQALRAMGEAYDSLLIDLGISDRNDPLTQIIAKDILQVTGFGIRDAEGIREKVLSVFKKSIL